MKRLVILTLLASPVFAHETPFHDKTFLNLTEGDPVKAQSLSWYCESSGKDLSQCAASFSGDGNMSQEAALNCQEKFAVSALKLKFPNGNKEAPGARAHQADGRVWHADYQRDPQGGRLHRHVYSEYDKKKARDFEIRDRIVAYRTTTDGFSGDATLTKTVSTAVGMDQGLITQLMNLMLRYDVSTATEMAKKSGIPETVLKEIYEAGQAAYNDPKIAGILPTITCYKEERDCRDVPEGERKTNDQYDPDAEKKKDDKKGT